MKDRMRRWAEFSRQLRPMLGLLLVLVLVAGLATEGSAKSKKKKNQSQTQTAQTEVSQGQDQQGEPGQAQTEKAGTQQPQSAGTKSTANGVTDTEDETEAQVQVEEDGTYTSKEEVAAYLHEFGKLPDNFITKQEARDLGWDNSKGNLDKVAPGKSIGGDRFGNYEGLLPEKKGRKYQECDIDYNGGYRGAKRIIFSNDGLVYYTEDHYQTFELLYGKP